MVFKIHKTVVPEDFEPTGALGMGDVIHHPARTYFTWALVRADDSVVCRGPGTFAAESDARSNIAQAKKSMKGAMRCKVLSPDG